MANGKLNIDELYAVDGNFRLDPVAAAAYLQMVEAARADGVTWAVTETYRDLATQVSARKSKGGIMAQPGTSNHGLGTALDLRTGKAPLAKDRALPGGDPASKWLKENAAAFGFRTLSDKDEPWHWEYTGDPKNVATARGQKPADALRLDANFVLPNSGKPVPKVSVPGWAEGKTALSESDKRTLAYTLLGEAAGEGQAGMEAVMHVIQNRAKSGKYPESLAAVATQKSASGKHQFSTWNSRGNGGNAPMSKFAPDSKEFNAALAAIDSVLSGKSPDPTRGATHYYAAGTKTPGWFNAEAPKGAVKIGDHVFGARADAAASPVEVPPRRPDTVPAKQQRQVAQLPSGKEVEVGRIYTIDGKDFIGGVSKDGKGTLTKAPASIIGEAKGKSLAGEAVRSAVVKEVGKGVRSAAAAAPGMAQSAVDGASQLAGDFGNFVGSMFADVTRPRSPAPARPATVLSAAAKSAAAPAYTGPSYRAVQEMGPSSKGAKAKAPVVAAPASVPAKAAVAATGKTVAQIGQEADNARLNGYRSVREMSASSKGAPAKAAPAPAPAPALKVADYRAIQEMGPSSKGAKPKAVADAVPSYREIQEMGPSTKGAKPKTAAAEPPRFFGPSAKPGAGSALQVMPGVGDAKDARLAASAAAARKVADAKVAQQRAAAQQAAAAAAAKAQAQQAAAQRAAAARQQAAAAAAARATAMRAVQFQSNGVANPAYRNYSNGQSEGGGVMPANAFGGNGGGGFTDSLGDTYYDRHL